LNKNYEDGWLSNKSDGKVSIFGESIHMHPDDLKAIWICHECRTVFIFHSDIDDHKDSTSHELIEKVMISPAETLAE
jgi:hypothetical protein